MKKLLLKTMLLLCALIAGSGTMWGQKITDYANIVSGTQYYIGATTGGNDYYLSVDGSTTTNSIAGTAVQSKASATIFTFEGSGTSWTIQFDSGNYVSLKNGKDNGKVQVVENAATFTASNQSSKIRLTIGNYSIQKNNSGTQFGSYANTQTDLWLEAAAPSYTITAQSNNNSYGTVSLNGSVIMATPANGYTYASPAYTVSPDNSATVVQEGNTFTVTPSANTTVTINFEAIPTHTATFSVNGVTTSQDYQEGADIVFPDDPANVDNMAFMGWVSEAIEGTTNEAPIYVTSPIMGQNDVTYYAVFAEQLGSGNPSWAETALADLTASDIFVIVGGGYAMTNDNGTSSAPAAEAITVSAGKLTTPTPVPDNIKWNVSGNATDGYTFYPNGTTETWLYCNTTASSSSNNNMRVGTGNRKVFELNASGYLVTKDKNTTRYLSLYNNQDFRGYVGTSNGAFVPVFYKYSSPISYSGYCTSFVVATVARPTIEVADNPFTFSTTATITCETEGAAIRYSYDGENWSNYEGALTITATTTIYAKAVKDETESSVASVEVTKNLAENVITVTGGTSQSIDLGQDEYEVELTAAATNGATVTFTIDSENSTLVEDDDFLLDENIIDVFCDQPGVIVLKANAAGDDDYAAATEVTITITVDNSKAPGRAGNPYTVAQARAAIDAGTGVTGVYATGIVSEIVSDFNPTYGNITYNISADGLTTSDQLQAYRGFSYNGDWFKSAADIQVGDVVVIYGNLTNYKGTYEFNQNNQLVSLVEAATVGSAGYTTYVTRQDVSFPAEVEAYIATTVNGAQEYLTLTQVNSAPKGTPVVLKNEGTFTLSPTASPEDVSENLLLASDGTIEGDGSTIFALGNKSGVGFYLVADGQTVPAGKAYLSVPAAVKGFLAFDFGDIDAIKTVQGAGLKDAAIFNLAGQRMSRMHRGVNLVNGKKIILK